MNFIEQFGQFTILHRSGVSHGNADAMSRKPAPETHANNSEDSMPAIEVNSPIARASVAFAFQARTDYTDFKWIPQPDVPSLAGEDLPILQAKDPEWGELASLIQEGKELPT